MIKYLSLLLTLIFSSSMYCQEQDTTSVAFVSYWSIGDSYDFNVSKIKQKWKNGKITKDEQENYIAHFSVIDSTETSYTISWTYENDFEKAYLGNTYNIPDELLDKLSKYKLTEIIYRTSEVGDFLDVINWKEISDMMNNIFTDLQDALGEKGAPKAAIDQLRQIFSSKEGIEQLVMKEIQYFHFPLGLEYDITEPVYYDEELPNMFGGDPIKAKGKIYFEDVDFENGYCVLKQELSIDPDDMKRIVEQIGQLSGVDSKAKKDSLKAAIFQIEDKNVFEYYYYPGVPHRIETTRETTYDVYPDKNRQIEKIIIELIYDE